MGRGGLCVADAKLTTFLLLAGNTGIALAGLLVLGVGAWMQQGHALNSYAQYEQVNPLVAGLSSNGWVYIVSGSLLAGVGLLGVVSACLGVQGCGKPCICVYNLLLVLAIVYLLALTVLAWVVYSTTGPGGASAISRNSWRQTVQSKPQFVCAQEQAYSCAGYSRGDCQPGSANPQLCPGQSTGGQCRTAEDEHYNTGCDGPLNQAVQHSWYVAAIVATCGLGLAVFCYVLSCWNVCCTCCGC